MGATGSFFLAARSRFSGGLGGWLLASRLAFHRYVDAVFQSVEPAGGDIGAWVDSRYGSVLVVISRDLDLLDGHRVVGLYHIYEGLCAIVLDGRRRHQSRLT